MNWYFKVLKQYADFNGRARRKEYWMFTLFNMIFVFIAMLMDNIFETTAGELPYGLFYFLYVLAIFIPGLAVSVRRLHDVGKSGWMYLIIFIPLVGAIWLLVLMVTDSDPGDNEYGPNPKLGNINDVNVDTERRINTSDMLVFLSIAYWFTVNLVNFIIQKLVDNWYDTPAKYFQIASNIIFAIIPIIFALSVRNKKLKIIAIILSALISVRILYSNIDWLIESLK